MDMLADIVRVLVEVMREKSIIEKQAQFAQALTQSEELVKKVTI